MGVTKYLVIDFETFSRINLKTAGAYELARHSSTEVVTLCFAYGTLDELKLGTYETGFYCPILSAKISDLARFERYLRDTDTVLVAHNVWFDANILRFVFAPKYFSGSIDFGWYRWIDTMALCLVLALPRSLGDAAKALKLKAGKDSVGNRLALKWAKPKPESKTKTFDKTQPDNWPEEARRRNPKALEELYKIIRYCARDVDVTVRFLTMLRPLDERERALWVLTQEINDRGFAVDRDLVGKIGNLRILEYRRLDYEILKLTGGAVSSSNQVREIQSYLKPQIPDLENLRSGTVAAQLERDDLPENARKVLQNRQARARTSLAKFPTIDASSRHDGRVHGAMVHHAASTGRWQGVLVNPLNLPRGISNSKKGLKPGLALEQAIEAIREGDMQQIKQLYGDPLKLFSHVLRGVIVPGKGRVFHAADYSQIEARVCFWLCDNKRVLDIFREGIRDIYCEAAADIFGGKPSDYAKDSFERFIGKEQTLGCIFSMGWKRFMRSLEEKGHHITPELAQKVVNIFRNKNPQVVRMWAGLERAALAAVQKPGKKFHAAKCTYYKEGDFLFCRLPSGRELAYYGPEIKLEMKPWGDVGPSLYYWTQNPRTKKYEFHSTYGGKLCENVTQATARDFMAEAKLRLARSKDWQLVLSVHDEMLAEKDMDSPKTLDDYVRLLTTIPNWGEGCPVAAEGWEGLRYRK